ncbi:MAG: arginase [Vicingaceae bacterium]
MKKSIVFIENMSELGAGTRGASLGFQALKMAALKFGSDLFIRYPIEKVETDNSGLHQPVEHPFAKHIPEIYQANLRAAKFIMARLESNKLPLVISGDHSNAIATIAAIRSKYPKKKLGVIWVDAHADLHSPYTTPSGNMHGMPLGASLALDNEENHKNEPVQETIDRWTELENLLSPGPKLNSDDLVFFAVRDTERAENVVIDKFGLRNYRVDELRHRGFATCLAEAKDRLKECELLYISFDVDSMDCDLVSSGTGTPVPHGLSPDEAFSILQFFCTDPRLTAMEVVEVNPLLDNKGNTMAETTQRILDKLLRYWEKNNKS